MSLNGYVTLDVETTVTEYLGRKASPFTSENWIVASAYAKNQGPVQSVYWGNDREGSRGYLAKLLREEKPQFLVGFNIKFDLLHLLRYEEDYEAWMDWIVAGGQLWDSQLAEYLLDGQDPASHYISLDETTIRYGGEVKIDEVKALWAQGVNTPDIPKQLLLDYLTGRTDPQTGEVRPGDIGNTRIAFIGQTKLARKRGQTRSIQLNNGALVATIEMERNGLQVDVELGRARAAELQAKSEELRGELQEFLPNDLPFVFNWGSPKQKSALIFGGGVKYQKRVLILDEDGQPAYAKKDETGYELATGGWTLLPPESGHIPEEHYVRYASGKNKGLPKTKKVKVNDPARPKSRMEDFIYEFSGFTKPKPEWASDTPGVYSTKADIIEELGGRGIPFLDKFAELADVVKDLGTYYISEEFDDDGNVVKSKGMLTLVHPDGRVHAQIGMTGTVTGRFNHSSPNVGNLPRKDTSEVKKMFVSRFGEDGSIVQSDFTSLEIYMQALLSMDKQLIRDLIAGLDMHIKRLTQAYKKEYDWLVQKIKVEEDKEWKVKRTHIKVFSFQRAYGAGAPKIARYLKVPVEDVEAWMEADEALYPGIAVWQNKVAALVEQSREPMAKYVTHPTAKVALQLGKGHYKTWDGKRYWFFEGPAPDFLVRKGKLQGFMPTETKNYPVQGLGGEWMKAALWLAVRAFYKYRNFGGKALLVNTVHDAIYADVHESVRRKAAVLLHGAMLAASDFMGYWFDHDIAVGVPSETTYGPSMYVEQGFEDHEAFIAAAEGVRDWMRRTYME